MMVLLVIFQWVLRCLFEEVLGFEEVLSVRRVFECVFVEPHRGHVLWGCFVMMHLL